MINIAVIEEQKKSYIENKQYFFNLLQILFCVIHFSFFLFLAMLY